MILTGQALMSLRDSGFDLAAAVGEVVDNSIEARANRIRIRLDEAERHGKKHVHRITISDDGEGMDEQLLHHYLQIGYSTRYMRKDTIGKYGVGAKLAALNFGKRIDVWSRASVTGSWQHVSFDLDRAMEEEKATGAFVGIEPPRGEKLPADISDLAPSGTGTIVVWSEVDRLEHGRIAEDFDALRLSLEQELARMFREFIEGGIRIEVNGRLLLGHDPLFLMQGTWADNVLTRESSKESKTKKEDAQHFAASKIADEPVKVKGSTARLRVTLYPPEVTRKRGMGGDTLAKQLRVPENEGVISFMRMKREIAYNNVPRILPGGVQPVDRFIGIEVSFSPELDDFFGVRNVKRGVEPHGELRDKIRTALKKYIPQARNLLEERWGKVAREDHDHAGEHATIMDAVADVDKTMPKGRTAELPQEKVEQELENLATDVGRAETEQEKEQYIERIRGLPFVIESVDFPGKMFIDVKHLNNQVIIRVNTRHRFYRELWAPLSDIAQRDPGSVSGDDAIKTARRAVEGLALMVVAYGKAQSMDEQPAEKYDDLTAYWGQFIDTLMGKVKDVL
jgi:hypothetical protein